MCRIEFSISQRVAWREGWVDRLSTDEMLEQAGVRGGRSAYTSSHRFLGSNTLAKTLLQIAEIMVVLLFFGSVVAFRLDAVCALEALKTRLYLIFLPKIGSLLVGIVSTMMDALAARIPTALSFRFVETMSVMAAPNNLLFGSLVHAPIVEEMIFRYALFTVLTRWWAPLAAAVMTAATFSACHLQLDDTTRTIGLFVSGMLLQWLYVRYRSVIFCMLAHATCNGIVAIVREMQFGF